MAATNFSFSEAPQTGDNDEAQFRIWAFMRLDITCNNTVPTITNSVISTDVGFEGPLKGELDPLKSFFATNGEFGFIAAGRPHALADPTFQFISPRTNRTIWHKVQGRVVCDSDARAKVVLNAFSSSSFPSVRLWSTYAGGGQLESEVLIASRKQKKLTSLWSLANVPAL